MDIVIAVNDAYYEACRTMLHSLFTKNRKSVISIHLFYRQLTERERKGLCKYVEKLGGTFHSYIVPDSVFGICLMKDQRKNQTSCFQLKSTTGSLPTRFCRKTCRECSGSMQILSLHLIFQSFIPSHLMEWT